MTGELSNQEAVDQAFKDLDESISEDTKNNDKILKILTSSKDKQEEYSLSIDVFGEEVRIKPFIPPEIRKEIIGIFNKDYKDEDVLAAANRINNTMYESMAAFCLDHPWTDPDSWKYIDQQLGIAPRIWKDMILTVKSGEDARKSFRGK